ncbi:hypothetical protein V6N13_074194 [Hibiscus sabdariffa]
MSIATWKASKEKIACEKEESNAKVLSASTSSSISSPILQVNPLAQKAVSKVLPCYEYVCFALLAWNSKECELGELHLARLKLRRLYAPRFSSMKLLQLQLARFSSAQLSSNQLR